LAGTRIAAIAVAAHRAGLKATPAIARFSQAVIHACGIPLPENAMIKQMEGLPAGTLGFRAHGQVTAADYERVVVPDVEAAFALNRKLRLLYVIDEDFTGFDPGAMWDDLKMGARHFSGWERVALVTDVPWLRATANAMGFMVPGEFRLFALADLEKAKRWITERLPG
jgi:hypothetical protein